MALIKCPECGKKVSSKARVCINCGLKLKSNYLVGVLFMLFIFLMFVAWIDSHSKKIIDLDDKIRNSAKLQKEIVNSEVDSDFNYDVVDVGGWKVSSYKNKTIGLTSTSAAIMSETKILWIGEDVGRGAIFSVLESSRDGRSVTLRLIGAVPFCLRETCKVGVTFDAGKEILFSAYKRHNDTNSNSHLEIQSNGEIEQQIKNSKTMRIGAEFEEYGEIGFLFNVMNFDTDKYLNQ